MRWNHHKFLSPVQLQGKLRTWLSCVANIGFVLPAVKTFACAVLPKPWLQVPLGVLLHVINFLLFNGLNTILCIGYYIIDVLCLCIVHLANRHRTRPS